MQIFAPRVGRRVGASDGLLCQQSGNSIAQAASRNVEKTLRSFSPFQHRRGVLQGEFLVGRPVLVHDSDNLAAYCVALVPVQYAQKLPP